MTERKLVTGKRLQNQLQSHQEGKNDNNAFNFRTQILPFRSHKSFESHQEGKNDNNAFNFRTQILPFRSNKSFDFRLKT